MLHSNNHVIVGVHNPYLYLPKPLPLTGGKGFGGYGQGYVKKNRGLPGPYTSRRPADWDGPPTGIGQQAHRAGLATGGPLGLLVHPLFLVNPIVAWCPPEDHGHVTTHMLHQHQVVLQFGQQVLC